MFIWQRYKLDIRNIDKFGLWLVSFSNMTVKCQFHNIVKTG